jgi:hypothetical protein
MRKRRLESYFDEVRTVKQKAIFAYLNSLRGKMTKSKGSLRDIFLSLKRPFDESEIRRITGILQPHEIAEYQLWTNVLDIVVKIDKDLFLTCGQFLNWIKDLTVFLHILHQENIIHTLNEISLKIPLKKNLVFIESIKEKVIAKSVIPIYLSFVEAIYVGIFHLYAMHYSMDHAFDEKEDLCITQSLALLHDGERAFLTIFPLLTKSKECNKEELRLVSIYADKVETIKGWIYEMLTIHADVLAGDQIYVPGDVVERAINYAQKRLSDGVFRKENKEVFALDNPIHSDTIVPVGRE